MKIVLFFLCILAGFFTAQTQAAEFRFDEQDGKQLTLTDGTVPVFTYRYDLVPHDNVPDKDLRKTAGCYVHPLFGLNGEVLTDNAPLDHYHHHGVFWTWPHVSVHQTDGTVKQYDLWTSNTALKQHFVRWIQRKTTKNTAILEAENGWFVGEPQDGKKIMTERVKITVQKPQTEKDGLKSRAVDFEFVWKPTDNAVSLRGSEGKSYGGFSIRFKPFIHEELRKNPRAEAKKNEVNVITVPTGVAEKDLPETPLAWADYTSRFDNRNEPSGAAVFVPKDHPDFAPTWLTRYYGALCVGWPGVKDRKFEPGEEIKLRYRVWIHDGGVSVEQLEKAYQEYHSARKLVPTPRKRLLRRELLNAK